MSGNQAQRSKYRERALSWIGSLGAGTLDLDNIIANCSDGEFKYRILPRPLEPAALNSKAAYKEFLAPLAHSLYETKTIVHEVVEQAGPNPKIVIHASSDAKSETGARYTNQYMFLLHFRDEADGAVKISSITEFVDSHYTLGFFAAEKERKEKQVAQV
ncbi:hypothetical protein AURDEDRAFT_169276 [Auricularia subglabra TFB-10046 SS5]|nr:hypothetical protein AURDEDRAFT_169276 [Auricularia subglabra TFB-10046 SS5]